MASSSCVAAGSSVLTDRKRVIGELTRGREFADKLRLMLREAGAGGDALPAQELVGRILDTFTQSLSMLCAGGESDEVSQVPAVVNSPAVKSEDSGDSCKTPASKDRRGCYKRRRTSETWMKETPASFDDGHAWRKYGQKVILHAKFPRNYFRCTHKFDQGCQASKQVQQIEEDPPLFRTTYHGRHTCKNYARSHHHLLIDGDAGGHDSSVIWSFQSGEHAAPHKPDSSLVFGSSEAKAVIKQENEEEFPARSPPCRRDYCIPPDELAVFDTSADHHRHHLAAFSSGSDRGDVISSDVYSCTESTRSIVDMMVDSVDFDDFLEFGSLS